MDARLHSSSRHGRRGTRGAPPPPMLEARAGQAPDAVIGPRRNGFDKLAHEGFVREARKSGGCMMRGQKRTPALGL